MLVPFCEAAHDARRSRMRRPRYADVAATMALVLALGGTSYAVTARPRNSVGTAQLKPQAVTKAKRAPGILTIGPTGPRGLQGPAGASGQPGPQGVAGAAGGPPGPTPPLHVPGPLRRRES